MARYCFTLQVRPEMLTEYRARHAAVWPEMCRALAATGWRNYSMFARADGLVVGYVESDDLDAAVAAMGATAVNARWQAAMRPFFTGLDGGAADTAMTRLEQVFNLDDALAAGADGSESPWPTTSGPPGSD